MFLDYSFLTIIPRNQILKIASTTIISAIALTVPVKYLNAQIPESGGSITIRSDIQEANSETGVITARGNVQINYPAR
ncbi:MAG: OstA family protein, partial [Xenococcaceae cyanobacterium MO_188.B19]|nr:OstA family protein [Xenococcaceae cyanobacterium MO_188.B19]